MILIDYHSRVPIYEQIKEQIIMLIHTGVYKSGDKLPSIRKLSNELNINVNTIKRALAQLEEDGVIYSVQGKGVFVTEDPLGNKKIVENAVGEIRAAIISGKARGVTKDDLTVLISEIYKAGDSDDSSK